jgi:hypothetical protein
MPDSFGTQTEQLLLKSESHKMAHEFEAAAAIKKLQKVKLNNAEKVVALAADDDEHLCIGYALHDAAIGENTTVVVRGYALIKGISQAAVVSGPVQHKGFNATVNLNSYAAAASAAKCVGWNLTTAAAADEEIWVLVKN